MESRGSCWLQLHLSPEAGAALGSSTEEWQCPHFSCAHGCMDVAVRRSSCVYQKSHLFLERQEYPRKMALPREEIIPLPLAFGPFSPGSPAPVLPDWLWSPFSGTGQVLWFVVWTKPALVTPQCFTHCPAGLAQHRGLFLSTLCPHSECPGEVRDWGGTADPE